KTQVKIDGAEIHEASFKNKVATYNFMASYVRADASKEVTTGHVTTNAMYTFTYQ
ncbi:fimbrial protein, partial [Salmonella enterica subsp. enterica serovar Paratyphi A]